MKPEAFIKYIKKLRDELNKLNALAVKTADVEAVHDTRVAIKRLKAVYIFLDESKFFEIKRQDCYQKLRDYFKTAGRLRDLQLHRTLLNQYKKKNNQQYPEYEKHITDLEDFTRAHFYRNKDNYPVKEQNIIAGTLSNILKSIDSNDLYQASVTFISTRQKKLEDYYLQYNSGEYLHKTRQTLKELRYFLEMFLACSNGSKNISVRFDRIKQAEEILGGWNDKQLFSEDLRRFHANYRSIHSGKTIPSCLKLISQVTEDAGKEIEGIQPLLLDLIAHLSFGLLKLK